MNAQAPVVGYVRVSTSDQGANGHGLEAQRQAITEACERRGWLLARIEEDVESGKSLKRRPGLERALKACRAGEAEGLVVAKLDRLSRSVIDFAGLLDDARSSGYNIVALDLGIDLSTPTGELVANVMATVAQWERRIIGERTKTALAQAKRNGKRLGRPQSLPDSVRAIIAADRASGKTYAQIAAELNELQVPTAQGGVRWYPSTVRAAIR